MIESPSGIIQESVHVECLRIEFIFILVAEAGNLTFNDAILLACGGGVGIGVVAGGGKVTDVVSDDINAAFVVSSLAKTDITCLRPEGFLT